MALKSWGKSSFLNHFWVLTDKKGILNPPQKFTQTVTEHLAKKFSDLPMQPQEGMDF